MEVIYYDFGDGKNRELKLTLRAVRHFKENYGKSIWDVWLINEEAAEEVDKMPELTRDLVCLTHFYWAVLLKEEPNITLEQTENLLQKAVDERNADLVDLGSLASRLIRVSGLFGYGEGKAPKPKEDASPNAKGGRPLN